MKKMIIPRGDHEVYFIRQPVDLKTKKMRLFVIEQLNRLHPGFSSSSGVEFQQFVFNDARWIMATVMEAETLAEYKILHKRAAFYTNTSIAVHRKDFLSGGINIIDDERIGFDPEKNEPVSVPLEAETKNAPADLPAEAAADTGAEAEAGIKNIPARHGVFGGKTPRWRIAAIIASAALLLPAAFIINGGNASEAAPVETYTEPAAEMKRLPRAVEILADVSARVVEAGGKMAQWQLNEDLEPFLIIRMRGMDVLTVRQICATYDYFLLQDIQEVRYINNEPYLTLYVNASRPGYAAPAAVSFPDLNFILPAVSGLANDLRQGEITIVSEALPAAGSGSNFYTVTYTVNGRNLVRSLDVIGSFCGKYPLRIKRMDVSINSDNNRFTVVCSLAQCDANNPVHAREGDESIIIRNEKIPAAFGYKENQALEKQTTAAAPNNKTPENDSQVPVLGTIRDGSGRMLFYRDTSDGKIKVRGDP